MFDRPELLLGGLRWLGRFGASPRHGPTIMGEMGWHLGIPWSLGAALSHGFPFRIRESHAMSI